MRASYFKICSAENKRSSTVLILIFSLIWKVLAVCLGIMICPIICFDFFLDYGILERQTQLEETIGVLDMEVESYELSKLMAWVFYPTWILLTIVQAICFILYNGTFHPLSKILDGCNVERKGMFYSIILILCDLITKH